MAEDRPSSFQEMFVTLFAQNQNVMVQRQKKYGKSNIPRYGTYGTLVRMGDKFSRLENFVDPTGTGHGLSSEDEDTLSSEDESLEDTLIDIANYATIMRAQLRGWWTKEFCPDLLPEH